MTLRVLIHNVGHGQAVHVFTPNGKVVVIDLGCRGDFSPLSWLSKSHKKIDYLVVTHPHGDHIDEFLRLSELGFSVQQIWRPKWLEKEAVVDQNQSSYSDKLEAYFDMSDRYSAPITAEVDVASPRNNGGATIKVFSSPGCGQSNINNHSGVVYIEYAGSAVIIPGDNEPPSWRELLLQPDFVRALGFTDVFMASHHGRESGYCSDIFEKKPKLCVISDGRVQDTDATSRYSYHANGWSVHKRADGSRAPRNCITTRTDGYIDIKMGYQDQSSNPFLAVHID